MPSPLRTKRFSRAVISLVPLLVRPILHIITPDDGGDDYTAAVRRVGYLAGVRPFLLRKVQQLCRPRPSLVRPCARVRRRLRSERSVSNAKCSIRFPFPCSLNFEAGTAFRQYDFSCNNCTHSILMRERAGGRASQRGLSGLVTRGVIGLELRGDVAAAAEEEEEARRRAVGGEHATAVVADTTRLM